MYSTAILHRHLLVAALRCRDAGDFDTCASSLAEARDISHRLGDPQLEGRILKLLGDTYQQQGMLDASEDAFQRLLFLTERLAAQTGAAGAYYQLRVLARPRCS